MSSYSNVPVAMAQWRRYQHQLKFSPVVQRDNTKTFEASKDAWRKYITLWRSYPDYFLDFIRDSRCKITLHWYQRFFLRMIFRFRKVFITATRGTAKSYTCILGMYLLCIFYPGIKLAICAPGKEQAASIGQERLEEIWYHFPLLHDEIKKSEIADDDLTLHFHNSSRLDIVQQKRASKGGRRNGVLFEEIAQPENDGQLIEEVVLPLMANPRMEVCGGVDPDEIQNRELYMTTAGTRQSYGFSRLQNIIREMTEGKSAMFIGAGYEMACDVGQLKLEYVLEKKESYNPLLFAREFESKWTGSSDKSLVSLEALQKCRILDYVEEYAMDKNAQYVLAYDVARAPGNQNANSILTVFKIKERRNGEYERYLVNMFGIEGMHNRIQALFLKEKVKEFNACVLVIDANGLGSGVVDELMLDLSDGNPPYAVINNDEYDRFTLDNAIPMIYTVIANSRGQSNDEMYSEFIRVINNHKLKMPYSANEAQLKFLNSKQKIDGERLAEALRPYAAIDLFIEEVMNLEYKQVGNKTDVKQVSRAIQKDRFSAAVYGLWWIYLEERKNKERIEETSWSDYIYSGQGKATIGKAGGLY